MLRKISFYLFAVCCLYSVSFVVKAEAPYWEVYIELSDIKAGADPGDGALEDAELFWDIFAAGGDEYYRISIRSEDSPRSVAPNTDFIPDNSKLVSFTVAEGKSYSLTGKFTEVDGGFRGSNDKLGHRTYTNTLLRKGKESSKDVIRQHQDHYGFVVDSDQHGRKSYDFEEETETIEFTQDYDGVSANFRIVHRYVVPGDKIRRVSYPNNYQILLRHGAVAKNKLSESLNFYITDEAGKVIKDAIGKNTKVCHSSVVYFVDATYKNKQIPSPRFLQTAGAVVKGYEQLCNGGLKFTFLLPSLKFIDPRKPAADEIKFLADEMRRRQREEQYNFWVVSGQIIRALADYQFEDGVTLVDDIGIRQSMKPNKACEAYNYFWKMETTPKSNGSKYLWSKQKIDYDLVDACPKKE